jgi:hypothetical protein
MFSEAARPANIRVGDSACLRKKLRNLPKPAFSGCRTDFRNGHADSDIGIRALSWIERGGHGAPGG